MSNLTTQLSNYSFENHQIRTILRNGEIWFIARDVCDAVKISNVTDALIKLDDEEKATIGLTDSQGGMGAQRISIVSESGMYTLILRCRDAVKKDTVPYRFRKWVTSEVLPSIRKNGSYSLTINEEQQYLISKAVDERVYRTGEKHQTIYHKFYDRFRITSYKNLPASKFDEAMKFLGGVQRDYKAVNLDNLKHQQKYLTTIQEYYYRVFDLYNDNLAEFLKKNSPHLHYNFFTALEKIQVNTAMSLNFIRTEIDLNSKPKSRVINFAADIDYLESH